MRHTIKLFFAALICILLLPSHKGDEGMFPLSQLNQIDFKKAGFNISQSDIYNPEGVALTDALVRLGGCTGSFISSEGLIITNHHCVFGSVASVSSKENDYLEKGFYASERNKEIKIGLTCKITKSYEDVSSKVLDGIQPGQDPVSKKTAIKRNIDALIKAEQAKNPGLSIEVSEMFVGYSYTLFRYQVLKDVRLVYVPPRDIGEFGGETDNWEWPKHTGDFSIVRAYVGKDGNPAEYSPDNVPYTPKKFLKINQNGTKNNDLVFILGYPGVTYRHDPYQFIQYQQEHVLPFISDWYGWRMSTMENLGKKDRDRYLRLSGSIKSLANTKKNFEGKMFGLKQTGLLNTKKAEQEQLMQLMKQAGADVSLFAEIDSLYANRLRTAQRSLLLNRFNVDVGTLSMAFNIINSRKADGTIPDKTDSLFWSKWKKQIKDAMSNSRIVDAELDRLVLAELIERTKKMNGGNKIVGVSNIKHPKKWAKNAYKKSFLDDVPEFLKLLDEAPWKVYSVKDPITELAMELMPELKENDLQNSGFTNRMSSLLPRLLEAKIKYAGKSFIPDANSTLRFTFGHISGYKSELNKHPEPYTLRREIFEKNATDNKDYRLGDSTKKMLMEKSVAPSLLDPTSGDVVVCMLYNMDTTGGNSGSPVMDANGNLVGVNFDRAYTATLNDYSWNPDYSRSIAVDIRYVIYTIKYLNQADKLLAEMGVKL